MKVINQINFLDLREAFEASWKPDDESDAQKVKKGAIITSYRTTADSGELPASFLDSTKANVITDWENSLTFVQDLIQAIDKQILKKEDIIYLKDLIESKAEVEEKDYTVFRATGTPMQNVAVLKELLEGEESDEK